MMSEQKVMTKPLAGVFVAKKWHVAKAFSFLP